MGLNTQEKHNVLCMIVNWLKEGQEEFDNDLDLSSDEQEFAKQMLANLITTAEIMNNVITANRVDE